MASVSRALLLLLLVLVVTPCLPTATHMPNVFVKRSQAVRLQRPLASPIGRVSTVIFWRRGRKFEYERFEPGGDIWDKSGLRQQWYLKVVPAVRRGVCMGVGRVCHGRFPPLTCSYSQSQSQPNS